MCLRLLKFNLRVCSFNTYGIKSSSETIQQQLCTQNDLILIQESWLYPDELSYVSNLCEEFSSFSLSSMSTENKLIRGRPHGGISIMWRKTLSRGVKIIQYDDERILGIELKTSDFIILILCIYMPYECNEFYDDFCFYLDKVKCIIESANTPYVFVMGDFNADIKSSSILDQN